MNHLPAFEHLSNGRHSRETYVCLVYGLVRSRFSGTVQVRLGRRERAIDFISGRPVRYRSNLPEERVGMNLNRGIGAALQWRRGEWTIRPNRVLGDVHVDPRLLPKVDVFHGLWTGMQRYVRTGELSQAWLTDGQARVGPGPWDAPDLGSLGIRLDVDELRTAIEQECAMEQVMEQMSDPTGVLRKLLWFLEATGFLAVRTGPEVD